MIFLPPPENHSRREFRKEEGEGISSLGRQKFLQKLDARLSFVIRLNHKPLSSHERTSCKKEVSFLFLLFLIAAGLPQLLC